MSNSISSKESKALPSLHEETQAELGRSNDIMDLLSSTSLEGSEEPGDLTEDSVLDGEMLAQIERKLSNIPPPMVVVDSGPGISRGGLVALIAVAVAIFGVAFVALYEVDEMSEEVDVHQTVSSALISEISLKDDALAALHAAHQREIDRLNERISSLSSAGDETPEMSVILDDLRDRLEEVKAEAYQTEEMATMSRGGDRDRARRRGKSIEGEEGPRSTRTTGSSRVLAVAQQDDNPYDGVSSATNLNNRMWENSDENDPGENSGQGGGSTGRIMAGLMEAAVDTPSVIRPAENTDDNSLPTGLGSLPERPGKTAVRETMNGVAAAVRDCGLEQEDRVVLRLVVSGATGRVIDSVAVDDGHRGTSAGLCAARAARLAKFPPFAMEKVSIKYPFSL